MYGVSESCGVVGALPLPVVKFKFAVGRPSRVLGQRKVHVQNQTQSRKDMLLYRLTTYETVSLFVDLIQL